jgi:hypothetical protein
MMTTLDILVVVEYFVITIAAGVWFTKASTDGLRSDFLGSITRPDSVSRN